MRILTTVAFVMTTMTVFSLPNGDCDGVFISSFPPHPRQKYVDDGDYGHILGEDDAGYHGNVCGRWYFDDNSVPHPFPPPDGDRTMILLTKVAIAMVTKTAISLPLPTAKATVTVDFFPLLYSPPIPWNQMLPMANTVTLSMMSVAMMAMMAAIISTTMMFHTLPPPRYRLQSR